MTDFIEIDDEVFYTNNNITKVSDKDVMFLKGKAKVNKRKRARLCAHPDRSSALHEMVIVLSRGIYIPPHKHFEKSESFHIIEGSLDVVIFIDDGGIREVISMSERCSGDNVFFYRLGESLFHTVLPTSEMVVFHETTNGPFRKEDTVFAEWAPNEDDPNELQCQYSEELRRMIGKNR